MRWCFERPLSLPPITNHPSDLDQSRDIFANYCDSYWSVHDSKVIFGKGPVAIQMNAT